MDIEHLKYPIGRDQNLPFTTENKAKAIQEIKSFPEKVKNAVKDMDDEALDTPYRPGGWTKRQVVHHCADSHMNAYIRFKLALTEDTPTIKAYDEGAWAELDDSKSLVQLSIRLLESLHERWSLVLEHMTDSEFERTYYHPEKNAESTLGENLLHYDWHCRHHLGHLGL